MEWAEWGVRYGSFDMEAEPDRVFAPEGESWNSFHERVRSVLERLAQEYEGQTVVAVCHGGVITGSVRVLLGVDQSRGSARVQPVNTGLTFGIILAGVPVYLIWRARGGAPGEVAAVAD